MQLLIRTIVIACHMQLFAVSGATAVDEQVCSVLLGRLARTGITVPTKPFVAQSTDRGKSLKMTAAESAFIDGVIAEYRALALDSFKHQDKNIDRFNYYLQFHAQPPIGGRGVLLDFAEFVTTDTRTVGRLPKPGEPTIWEKLSAPGRLHLAAGVAGLQSAGTYDKRYGDLGNPTGSEGYVPLRVISAAQRGARCGECRLAANVVATLLGELGIAPEHLRVTKSDDHQWVEIQINEGGGWWVIDGTPRMEPNGIPNVGPINHPSFGPYRAGKERRTSPLLMLPANEYQLSPISVNKLSASTSELTVRIGVGQSDLIAPAVRAALAQNAATKFRKLNLAISPEIQDDAIFENVAVKPTANLPLRHLSLEFWRLGKGAQPGPTADRALEVVAAAGRMPWSRNLIELDLQGPCNAKVVDAVLRNHPALRSLTIGSVTDPVHENFLGLLGSLEQKKLVRLSFGYTSTPLTLPIAVDLISRLRTKKLRVKTLNLSEANFSEEAKLFLGATAVLDGIHIELPSQ